MKIVVLAGGYSPEREVSLTSGSLIANALMQNGHRVLLLDVYEGIRELPEDIESLFLEDGCYTHSVSEEVPDLEALRARCQNGDALIGANVLRLCAMADKVFLALHGSMGENGQLQATLDSHGISYTGSGYAGSMLAMDKDLSKRLFRDAGVPTPNWVWFDLLDGDRKVIIDRIGLPCVVKPCDCGSSVGVSMVDTEEELAFALSEAAKWGRFAVVEQKIVGRELTVGILCGRTLPAVEIIPQNNSAYFDYAAKYQAGGSLEVCPADITEEEWRMMGEATLRLYHALGLTAYSRADFILTEDDTPYFLEINTLPGMTPTSLLPQEAAAAGIDYAALCERILEASLEARKQGK